MNGGVYVEKILRFGISGLPQKLIMLSLLEDATNARFMET